MNKRFVGAEELLLDSFRLAMLVYESGFRPRFIVGMWRGGSPVGIALQDCLEYLGVETDHFAVRTSYSGLPEYEAMVNGAKKIRVHGMQYLLENVAADKPLLVVDDVYSSGKSTRAVIEHLSRKARRNTPEDIRVAVPWYRPRKKSSRPPDYFLYETQDWLVMPYELRGLSLEEIRTGKPYVAKILDEVPEKPGQPTG